METKESTEGTGWYYAWVRTEGGTEAVLGFEAPNNGGFVLPAFITKTDAMACYGRLPRNSWERHEIQAIHEDDLKRIVRERDGEIYVLDADGGITKQISG